MSRLEVIGLTQGQLPRDGEVKIGFGLEEGTRNLSEGNCQNQTYLGASQGERHFTQIWGNKGKYPTRKFTSWAQRKGFARVQLIHMVLEGKQADRPSACTQSPNEGIRPQSQIFCSDHSVSPHYPREGSSHSFISAPPPPTTSPGENGKPMRNSGSNKAAKIFC